MNALLLCLRTFYSDILQNAYWLHQYLFNKPFMINSAVLNLGGEFFATAVLRHVVKELFHNYRKCVFIRLEAHDKNSNFNSCRHQDLKPEYSMLVPDGKKYKYLHADTKIPRISMDCVAVYLHTTRTIRLLIKLVRTTMITNKH